MQSIALLANIITSNINPRFASLTYTAKGTGEVARHTLRLGASVEAAYKKDLATLTAKRATLTGVSLVACDEIIASLTESLTVGVGNNSAYTCKGVFTHVCKGVKAHAETGEIHVTGFSRSKVTLSEGVHKKVNSSEKTLAKNALRKGLLSGKFRQFVILNIESARLNGATLEM